MEDKITIKQLKDRIKDLPDDFLVAIKNGDDQVVKVKDIKVIHNNVIFAWIMTLMKEKGCIILS